MKKVELNKILQLTQQAGSKYFDTGAMRFAGDTASNMIIYDNGDHYLIKRQPREWLGIPDFTPENTKLDKKTFTVLYEG